MVILLRKRDVLLTVFFCCFFAGLSAVLWKGTALPAFSPAGEEPVIVIVDPGHGGEDGGAVSAGGVKESQLNLEISLRLNDLLHFAGQRTVMTRMEDISICDEGLNTIRQRKVSDLKNRVALVNEQTPAVLLSIHQNSLPSSPATHGAQAFYNKQDGAEALAESIQDALNAAANTGNGKRAGKIPDSIYLMKNITAPGILVECGFLSNSAETGQLQDPAYQLRLASAIAAGYLRGASESG
ncbi:MAG: N-acetylmuramoyl-L-alanine amidase [Oscillibacter sp.]|nr:N-acetylmuramoyl-L-alanine amidase [Oscillibacter sp.]MCI8688976.1 N-acetylmuramoyl-L-alanine amidase [Oscillibacter sp.]MCI9481329.1 N-acetylmuramoyl-L-alanine amidase [Oscillibacter sp.]